MTTLTKFRKFKSQNPIQRGFVVVLLSVAILLTQTFPAMSRTTTMWIEICVDGGSYMAEVDMGEGGPMSPCAHCDICALPAFELHSTNIPKTFLTLLLKTSIIGWSPMLADFPDKPEQYWSACRGPPLLTIDNKMTLTQISHYEDTVGTILNLGGAPWL